MIEAKSFQIKIIGASKYIYASIFLILLSIVSLKILSVINAFYVSDEQLELIGLISLVILLVLNSIIYFHHSKLIRSYSRWSQYTKELEDLNRVLSKQVNIRTKQIEESYQKEIDSLHTAAIMGRIIQPVLHDLSSPISAVKGAFTLLEDPASESYFDEILFQANNATDQIIRIIESGKELMSNRKNILEFSSKQLIEAVVYVLKDKLQKNEIALKLRLKDYKLKGIPALFERIILNVVMNSVEELLRCNQGKKIVIRSFVQNDFYVVEVEDNGRGIPDENLQKIFTDEFSTKDICNLGLGLKFVKKNIQKEFHGDIKVESKVNSYTKFILYFSIQDIQS